MNYLFAISLLGAIITAYYGYLGIHYNKRRIYARQQALYQLGVNRWHQAMTDKGFLFCGLFSLSHIEACAKEMNITLFKVDCLRVAAQIKSDFKPEVGISNSVIREAIKAYVMRYQSNAKNDQEYEFN